MRLLPHIFIKMSEDPPSFANSDPPSAVIHPLNSLRIGASLNHVGPTSVSAALHSPESAISRSPLHIKAPAGLGVSREQGAVSNDRVIPALTKADGSSFVALGFGISDHFKSSKSLSDEGSSGRHGIGNFNVLSSGGSPATNRNSLRLNERYSYQS